MGVQTPEFEFEKNIDDVKAAIKQYEIKYPVIQDNNYATWNAYETNTGLETILLILKDS